MADEPPPPPAFERSESEGGIPIFHGDDITVTSRSRLNFHGRQPTHQTMWYGTTSFKLGGERWSIEGFLNSGATGQTYTVRQSSTGKIFAAKFIDSPQSKEVGLVKKFPRELVQHPNVIKYEIIVENVRTKFPPACHIIFMEHIPNGELFDFIASPEHAVVGKPVSEGTSRRFLHDIVSGMAEFYRCCMTHRDLKPENLMLNEVGRIVIIDMDTVKAKVEAPEIGQNGQEGSDDEPPPPPSLDWSTTVNAHGTPGFAAPEVRNIEGGGNAYSCQAADAWSVGVIAFCLHAKRHAFAVAGGIGIGTHKDISGPDNDEFWKKMEASNACKQEFPLELKAFINCLWQKDPDARPSFRDMKDACSGGEDTLKAFPGLQWLAAPVNGTSDFIAELRATKPKIKLHEDKMLTEAP